MYLHRRAVLALNLFFVVLALWQHQLGRNLMGFFAFAAKAELSPLLAQAYSQILTIGELGGLRALAYLGDSIPEPLYRIWAVAALCLFPFLIWQIDRRKSYPILLSIAVLANPYLSISVISGQLTPLWVAAASGSLWAFQQSRFIWAGLLFVPVAIFSHLSLFLLGFIGILALRNTLGFVKFACAGSLASLLLFPLLAPLPAGFLQAALLPQASFPGMMAKNIGYWLALDMRTATALVGLAALAGARLYTAHARSAGQSIADYELWLGAALTLLIAMLWSPAIQGINAAPLPFLILLALRSRVAANLLVVFSFGLVIEDLNWLYNLHFGKAFELQTSNGTDRLYWFTPASLTSIVINILIFFYIIRKIWRWRGPASHDERWDQTACTSADTLLSQFVDWSLAWRKRLSTHLVFPLKPRDIFFLGAVLCTSLLVNFFHLGSKQLPVSALQEPLEVRVMTAPEATIGGLWLMGNGAQIDFQVRCTPSDPVQNGYRLARKFVYRWAFFPLQQPCQGSFALHIHGPSNLEMYEILIFDIHGKRIIPKEICQHGDCKEATLSPLFDEQDLVAGQPGIYDGAIYDEFFNFGPGLKTEVEPVKRSAHPFFARSLIGFSMHTFGVNPFAFRFPGALLGGLIPLVLFFLARELTGQRLIAVVATLYSLCDNARVSLSTLATTDSQLTLYLMLALLFFALSMRRFIQGERTWLAFLVGFIALLGASVATKLSGLFVLPGLAICLWAIFGRVDKSQSRLMRRVIQFGSGVAVSIFLFHVFSYVYLQDNPSIAHFGEFSMRLFVAHAFSGVSSLMASSPLTWPIIEQPVIAFVQFGLLEQFARFKLIMGNPATWWMIPPAFACFLLAKNFRRFSGAPILMASFISLLAVWSFVLRPSYIYHFLPASSVGMIILASVVVYLGRERKWLVWCHLGLVVATFMWFLPVTLGWEMSDKEAISRIWFPTWFFINR